MRRAALLVVVVGALGGCGEDAPPPTHIDEMRGTYRGVGIGDAPEDVFRVFGRVPISGTNEPVAPLKVDFVDLGGATLIATPCRARAPGMSGVATLRYDYVSFLLCDGRVHGFIVAVENARTQRGVAVGEDLDDAQDAYARISCGEARYGEGLLGEQPSYPYCGGRIAAKRWIWFGRDPIRSITISTKALRG